MQNPTYVTPDSRPLPEYGEVADFQTASGSVSLIRPSTHVVDQNAYVTVSKGSTDMPEYSVALSADADVDYAAAAHPNRKTIWPSPEELALYESVADINLPSRANGDLRVSSVDEPANAGDGGAERPREADTQTFAVPMVYTHKVGCPSYPECKCLVSLAPCVPCAPSSLDTYTPAVLARARLCN